MKIPNKGKLGHLFLQVCGNPTPKQALALGRVLIVLGSGIIAKMVLSQWPSIWATSIYVTLFCTFLVLATKYLRLTDFRWIIKGLPVFCTGAILNYTVLFANGGYMPSVARTPETASGIYIPLEGANLTYISDWIGHGISPGDIIMIATFVAMFIVYLRRGRTNSCTESSPAEIAQAIPQEPPLADGFCGR